MKGFVPREKESTLDEYCHFILGQGAVLPNSLILPFRDVKTKTMLLKDVDENIQIASVAYGKEIDARMYLWETIFTFLNPKEVYEKFMIDETISKLYQYTLDKAQKEKSPCPSFTACYEIVLNMCLIYSNMVHCRENGGNRIQAVCTEIDIQAIQTWMNKLQTEVNKIGDKHGKKIERLNMDVSDFRIALQIPAILSVIPVMKELGAYLYMMDILSATITRNEEIKEEKGYVW